MNPSILFYVICSMIPLQMKNTSKLAILQSLDDMDQVQMEDVLTYIKSILQESASQRSFKREAMKEIRQALNQAKKGAGLQLSV